MADVEQVEVGDNASVKLDSSQGQEEKAASDLQLAYKDQGYHEMEFTFGYESELHEKKQICHKNPGHLEFIPASEFTIEHLPECWRDSLLFEFISVMISLTVRLAVKYTSKDRPPNYPLYNRRGRDNLTAYGSGSLWHVSRKFKEKDGRTCPCKTCQQSPHLAKIQWAEFRVHSARHVVFDSSEARHARCDLFFDTDEDRYNCPSLEGVCMLQSDTERDYSLMSFVSHDEDVSKKVEELVVSYWKLRDEVREKYEKSGYTDEKMTAVTISHPHGLSKYVTVGEVTYRPESPFGLKWQYSAETCPGSSGGLVCILGALYDKLQLQFPWNLTHSGCPQKGHNESTGWWQ